MRTLAAVTAAALLLVPLVPPAEGASVTIVAPTEGAVLQGNVTITVDTSYVRTVSVRVGNGPVMSKPGSVGRWSVLYDTTLAPNGNVFVEATVIDWNGHLASAFRPVTVDNPLTRDLRIQRIEQSNAWWQVARADAPIWIDIQNHGNTGTGPFFWQVDYLDGGEWKPITKRRSVGVLAWTTQESLVIWPNVPPRVGGFHVRVLVDTNGQVAETGAGEGNNEAFGLGWFVTPFIPGIEATDPALNPWPP